MKSKSQIIIYQTEDGKTKIDVRLENENVWLTQAHMAELFQTTKQNIGQHLKSIFNEEELSETAVVKNFFTTAADGKNYSTNFYSLDAVISVGYRVKSHIATRFRQWATQQIREYIIKGFVLDDERLKNPDTPFDYFDELLRRIQDIRTSELSKNMINFISSAYIKIMTKILKRLPSVLLKKENLNKSPTVLT